MSLSIYHTLTHSLGCMSEREFVGTRERLLLSGDHLTIFGVLLLVLILSLRKLQGFLLYGFLEENSLCILSLAFIIVHFILLVKDPNIIMLA